MKLREILLIDGDVFSEIPWYHIYLSSSMSKVLVSFFPKLPVFRFMVLHIPIENNDLSLFQKIHRKQCSKVMSSNYFLERTGPDFIHPIYTLGLERWRARVAASVPAIYSLIKFKYGKKSSQNNQILFYCSIWQKSSQKRNYTVPKLTWTSSSTLT